MIPFRMNPRRNPGHPVPDPLMPGIIVTVQLAYLGYGESKLFYPAAVFKTSKSQMTYPGDRPGYLQTTPFISAEYQYAAQEALMAALQAKGAPRVEIATVAGTIVEKDLNWLERAARHGFQAERNQREVHEHIKKAAL